MPAADPRPMLHRSFDQATRVVRGVGPDQLARPTPCAAFDVADLLTHMVGVGRRIAGIGRGEAQSGALRLPAGVDHSGWATAFETTRTESVASWADPAVLERKIELPFGTFTGDQVAEIYTMELTAHTWDLASATRQVDALDEALAEASLAVARQVLPAQPRGGFIPFAAVVPVPDEASAYTRLAGFLGRQVA